MPYALGEHLIIVRGTVDLGEDCDDQNVDSYHYLMPGTLVHVTRVEKDGPTRPPWGSQYVVTPVDNQPECWQAEDDLGDQYVWDIHVELAPRPDLTDLAAIEAFLETP